MNDLEKMYSGDLGDLIGEKEEGINNQRLSNGNFKFIRSIQDNN